MLFKELLKNTGLSNRESAAFLKVSVDTVKSWASGRRTCPQGVLIELCSLIEKQKICAKNVINIIKFNADVENYELGFCCDDDEAQRLGFPFKSAHDAVLRMVLLDLKYYDILKIKLVPRGSTLPTAAAEI